jgi:hypothetical protein
MRIFQYHSATTTPSFEISGDILAQEEDTVGTVWQLNLGEAGKNTTPTVCFIVRHCHPLNPQPTSLSIRI